MVEVKYPACVALLGDLVASRDAPDRAALHARLAGALASANAALRPLDPLRVTAGDEFQGVFATTGQALAATFAVRLALRGTGGVRFGLGRGEVRVIDPGLNVQDGSAWWAAREALEHIERHARGGRRVLRTGLAAAPDAAPVGPELLTAVECVDALLAGVDDTSAHILEVLVAGGPQTRAASELGITPSAVSQRVGRDSLAVVADAVARLGGVA